ncbi:MAG: MFS transporter [Candidatus Nanopelagicales bacterium]
MDSRTAPARTAVAPYAAFAVTSRAATEALGPALLLAALASARPESDGALVVAGFTGLAALSGPFVGALLDRVARPGVVIGLATGTLVVVMVGMALLIPHAALGILVGAAAVGGFAHPALTGGLTSLLPSVVRPDALDRAYAVDAATYNIGAIVGPPLAAAMVVLGSTGPVVFTGALLLVALLVLPRVPFAQREASTPPPPLLAQLTTGFAGLASTRPLAWTTFVTTLGFAGQAAFLVAVPLVTLEQTGSLAASGLVFGAAAVGGVLATLWLARRPLRHPDRAIAVTTAGVGLALAVLAFSPAFPVTLAAAFALGACDGPMLTAMFRIRTREAAPAIRSQVFTTAASLRTSVYAATTAVLGLVVALGPTVLLLIGCGLHVLALGAGTLIRRPPPPSPEPSTT